MEEQYGNEYQRFNRASSKPFKPSEKPQKKNEETFGEYVDFEEID